MAARICSVRGVKHERLGICGRIFLWLYLRFALYVEAVAEAEKENDREADVGTDLLRNW